MLISQKSFFSQKHADSWFHDLYFAIMSRNFCKKGEKRELG